MGDRLRGAALCDVRVVGNSESCFVVGQLSKGCFELANTRLCLIWHTLCRLA
jgi:hypothetical protein